MSTSTDFNGRYSVYASPSIAELVKLAQSSASDFPAPLKRSDRKRSKEARQQTLLRRSIRNLKYGK